MKQSKSDYYKGNQVNQSLSRVLTKVYFKCFQNNNKIALTDWITAISLRVLYTCHAPESIEPINKPNLFYLLADKALFISLNIIAIRQSA